MLTKDVPMVTELGHVDAIVVMDVMVCVMTCVTVCVCHTVDAGGGDVTPQPLAWSVMGKHLVCPKLGFT